MLSARPEARPQVRSRAGQPRQRLHRAEPGRERRGLRPPRQEAAEPGGFQRLLGVGFRQAGELDQSRRRFEAARRLSPRDLNLWVDITAVQEDLGQHEAAVETVEKAIEEFGPARILLETRIKLFRRAGRYDDAIAWIERLIEKGDAEAWLYADLARTISHTDRPRANLLYKEALDRAPDDTAIMTAWADNLDRTRGRAKPRTSRRPTISPSAVSRSAATCGGMRASCATSSSGLPSFRRPQRLRLVRRFGPLLCSERPGGRAALHDEPGDHAAAAARIASPSTGSGARRSRLSQPCGR